MWEKRSEEVFELKNSLSSLWEPFATAGAWHTQKRHRIINSRMEEGADVDGNYD